jgi:tetratricopeptide (TPR) repeat protein
MQQIVAVKKKADDYFEKAESAILNGDEQRKLYEEAIKGYTAMTIFPIVRGKPGVLATMHLNAAAGCLRIDRDKEAIEQATLCLAAADAGPCDPSVVAQAYQFRGYARSHLKQVDEAKLDLTEAVRLSGNDPQLTAEVEVIIGELDGVAPKVAKILAPENPDATKASLLFTTGTAAYKEGDMRKATDSWVSAMEHEKKSGTAAATDPKRQATICANLASAYQKLPSTNTEAAQQHLVDAANQLQRALMHARKAKDIALECKMLAALGALMTKQAEGHVKSSEHERAVELMLGSIDHYKSMLAKGAKANGKGGKVKSAVTIDITKTHTQLADVLYSVGQLQLQLGKDTGAIAALKEAQAIHRKGTMHAPSTCIDTLTSDKAATTALGTVYYRQSQKAGAGSGGGGSGGPARERARAELREALRLGDVLCRHGDATAKVKKEAEAEAARVRELLEQMAKEQGGEEENKKARKEAKANPKKAKAGEKGGKAKHGTDTDGLTDTDARKVSVWRGRALVALVLLVECVSYVMGVSVWKLIAETVGIAPFLGFNSTTADAAETNRTIDDAADMAATAAASALANYSATSWVCTVLFLGATIGVLCTTDWQAAGGDEVEEEKKKSV